MAPQAADLRRATRLLIQYGIGAGLFVYLAVYGNPLWSLVVYATFVAWMVIRLLGARKMAGVMPGIIEKYDARVRELEARTPNGAKE